MADVRIVRWDRMPFDEFLDVVEIELQVYNDTVKLEFLLIPLTEKIYGELKTWKKVRGDIE